MRKYYIDNLRISLILILFPYHTSLIFDSLGKRWYINSTDCIVAALFNISVYPWWMSGLFALAGMSTVYALQKGNVSDYRKHRFRKLLIPFISAIFLLVPIQTYIADIFWNGFSGDYFTHFIRYFQITDFTGVDGCFTPAHTWFILYLYIMSIICLPLLVWYRDKENKLNPDKLTILRILPLFFIPLLLQPILNFGNKSFTEYTVWFLLGYFVLSVNDVQERLKDHSTALGIAWLGLMILRCVLYAVKFDNDIFWYVSTSLFGWIGILAIIGLGKRFMEFNLRFTRYFTRASFPIFLIHHPVIIIVGFVVIRNIESALVQFVIILTVSFFITLALYELVNRWSVTRFLFGIKIDRESGLGSSDLV